VKLATTLFLVAGLLLLAAWPWLVGPQPPASAGRQTLEEYVVRFGIYLILLLLVWFTTAVLAVLSARRARDAYREKAMENLQNLIEGTLQDHGKPKEP
jgi:type VI protein secretion system component VasK